MKKALWKNKYIVGTRSIILLDAADVAARKTLVLGVLARETVVGRLDADLTLAEHFGEVERVARWVRLQKQLTLNHTVHDRVHLWKVFYWNR